jgi:lysophospholipase L1-like esterase
MANHTLTQTSVTYATTGTKFGTGCQSGGYSVTPGGVIGTLGTTFTMECWFKKTGVPSGILVIVGGQYIGYMGLSASGFIIFNSLSNNATVTGTVNLTTGVWHHIAMVASTAGFVGYVDGVSVGSSTQVTSFGTTNPPVGIGAFDTGGFAFTGGFVDEVAFWVTAAYSGTFTPRISAYAGTEGMTALYHLDSLGTDSSVVATIAPNNAAIVYSPYNWSVAANTASSINAGAYFRTLFTGATCTLNFTVTNNTAPVSQIYYRVDGYEVQSPWTRTAVAATLALTIPADTATNAYHLLECVIKSTSETLNRWNAPSNTAVILNSLTLDSGATLVAPLTYSKRLIFYGDSITEGVRTTNSTAASDTDRNDVMTSWAWETARHLNAEFAIIGFGATGLTVSGSGNVPTLANSYNFIMAGVSRSFTPVPDMILLNEGTNDSGASAVAFQAAMQTMLTNLLAIGPAVKIVVLQTFAAIQATPTLAAVTAINSPRITYLNTTGFLNTAYGCDTLNIHPNGVNDSSMIAPQICTALLSQLYSPGRSYTFGL